GILNAVSVGTVNVVSSYAGFSGTNTITVIAPRFTDNFGTAHDYLTNGLPGSGWDGVYLRPGDLPGANNGGDTMFTTVADAGISTNNTLTVRAGGTAWEGAGNDGFFLFKNIPGDFQSVVHVDLTAHGAFQFAGIMARAANQNGSATAGGENHMSWWFFDQFNVTTSARPTINGAGQVNDQNSGTPINTRWLLLQRVNGTNFYCYSKANLTDPWILAPNAIIVQPRLTNGVPVQVGLAQSTFTSGPDELVRFDSFMLDGAGLVGSPPVPVPAPATNFNMTLNPDISMTLSWRVQVANDGTAPFATRSLVVMRAGAPVSAQPPLGSALAGNSVFGDPTQDLGGGNYVVYRSPASDTNLNQQVTVTGLSPGVTYYAVVYTFGGLGATRTFNTFTSATSNLVDGVLTGIQSSLLGNGIPAGGIAEITPAVHIVPANPAVVVTTNGVLTGVAQGSTTLTIDYSGFTNTLAVTVRAPSFSDNFGVSHDYLASGVAGTPWDGVYLNPGDVPDRTFVSTITSATLGANASANVLSVTNINVGFEFGQADGFFLFKYVPADFQMAVNLQVYTNNGSQSFNNSGLMARGYTVATNGTLGAPLGGAGLESWIAWERFDQFGIGTRYE